MYFTGTVGGLMTSLHLPLKNAKGEELPTDLGEDRGYSATARGGGGQGVQVGEAGDTDAFRCTPPGGSRRRDEPLYKIAWRVGVLDRAFYVWDE